LKITIKDKVFNIAKVIISIINEYIETKQNAFQDFVKICEDLKKIEKSNPQKVESFITNLLAPNVDARLFEIVSYAILKYYYQDIKIF